MKPASVPTTHSPSKITVNIKTIREQGNWKRFCELLSVDKISFSCLDDWEFELTLEQAVDCELLPPHYLMDFYSKLLELRSKNHG
jgi:hypothetical protein